MFRTLILPIVSLLFVLLASAHSASRPGSFKMGADISWIPQDEARGAEYYVNGVRREIFDVLTQHGFNYVRLRVFVDPEHGYSRRSPEDRWCGIEQTLKMAQRARDAGMGYLLNFHYSDTWADPEHQPKPRAWQDLEFPDLVDALYEYTKASVQALVDQGTPPDMVQIGNENTFGMLWPEGRVEASFPTGNPVTDANHMNVEGAGGYDNFAELLKAGIRAVREASPESKVMVHHHLGRHWEMVKDWMDNLLERGVEFDVVGFSAYQQQEEGDWERTIEKFIERYPEHGFNIVEYSSRKQYINDIVYNAPDQRGWGTFIWEPTRHQEAIFDRDGGNAGGGPRPNLLRDGMNPAEAPGGTVTETGERRQPSNRYEGNEFLQLYREMAADYGVELLHEPARTELDARPMFQDESGVIRWQEDGSEVILFGANYCLPSASDYRAARAVSDDLKGMIDEDMQHFARMRWDGLRLSFWGDSENTDAEGNLIENEHLDLLCYLIYRAGERGVYMLLSPIVNHTALWPGAMDQEPSGIFAEYSGQERGVNPDAIAAQVNYIRQLLEYVNPYTGVALKDDPFIPFVEMVNEPYHHVDDFDGSVHFINELVAAVKDVAPDKITFHNLTQAVGIADAMRASNVDGASIGWYPSGLVSGRTLEGNFLRAVDDFPPIREVDLTGLSRVVYEFDQADMMSNVMYPAMTRTFRSLEVQYAAMFSYDMLRTSRYNLGWQTHFLNLVSTPQKAVSSIIAGEVMREIAAGEEFGAYPENKQFGEFRLDYAADLSEWNSSRHFYYTSNTSTEPKDPESLEHIVGYGSSPVVDYSGKGIYFLDRIQPGVWRLEVHPDAELIADPYAQPSVDRVVVDIRHREWPMRVLLPDLGEGFEIRDLRKREQVRQTNNARFQVTPGIYLLVSAEDFDTADLPDSIGRIGMGEFVTLDELPFEGERFRLFDADADIDRLSYTRLLGEGRKVEGEATLRLGSQRLNERQGDFSASLDIVSRLKELGAAIDSVEALEFRARAHTGSGMFVLTLMEADGTSWVQRFALTDEWQSYTVPLDTLEADKGVLLPQAYPGYWSYWVEPTEGRGGPDDRIQPSQIERIQFSLREPDDGQTMAVELGAVDLLLSNP
ncbi:MAG: glycosyl hydrolase 53 family protein [Opitutales bacterium]|nr:glycosyl hydrolase 53 family protein [Opitutales bacterium]